VIDEIKDQGGIAILPHPFRGRGKPINEEVISKIDAIEGYNARTRMYENIKAQELASKYGLPMVAGSDAHFYGEVGLARTVMERVSLEEDVRKSILSNLTSVVGKQAPIYYKVGTKILSDIKTGRYYRLPYTLLRLPYKGIKMYLNKPGR
jgi:hypothetical protein